MCSQEIVDKTPSFSILQMIKETVIKNCVETQTEISQVISYSFDVCEKRLYKIFKAKTINCEAIFDRIKNEFGEIDCNHKYLFIRCLVSAVCRSCLNNKEIGFNKTKFTNICPVLLKAIDGNEDSELDALLAIKSLQHD